MCCMSLIWMHILKKTIKIKSVATCYNLCYLIYRQQGTCFSFKHCKTYPFMCKKFSIYYGVIATWYITSKLYFYTNNKYTVQHPNKIFCKLVWFKRVTRKNRWFCKRDTVFRNPLHLSRSLGYFFSRKTTFFLIYCIYIVSPQFSNKYVRSFVGGFSVPTL